MSEFWFCSSKNNRFYEKISSHELIDRKRNENCDFNEK